ncbi:MAG: WYL domain-containing protein [Bacteroidota bacterium]
MPSTKLAFFRYLLIDKMLRNKQKKYPTKQEILEECQARYGISSISTVEKDIQAMREEFDAPIKYFKRFRGYAYTESNYQFAGRSLSLSEEEKQAMTFVESLLEEFRDLPIFDSFSDAVDKVLDGLEITKKQTQSKHKKIWIDKSHYVKGSDLLHELVGWVSEERVLRISYKKHQSPDPQIYTLHPYLLKEYKNFWYLIGAAVERDMEIRTFGVDRILEVEPIQNDFISPSKVSFDPEEYYKHCIGMTVSYDESPQKIQLFFTEKMKDYVIANPIHHSQKVLKSEQEGLLIELFLVVNPELRNEVLSYGDRVKVVSPPFLAEQIHQEMRRGVEYYEK